MRFKLIFTLALMLSFANVCAQTPKPEVLEGCQGEGCSCFRGYSETTSKNVQIPTLRPFTLYAQMNKNAKLLGEFNAKTKAKPGKQLIVVNDPGEYVVEKVGDGYRDLKVSDRVTTWFNLGEGQYQVRKNKAWVSFDYDQIEVKELRPTSLTEWMEVTVGKLRGYTTDQPFEGCLE